MGRLDHDTWDKYYGEGAEAYFEGKTLSDVPITGNAWFREAWEEGWKNAKAYDDEDARRAEAEYEEELEWEEAYREGLTESKNPKRVKEAAEKKSIKDWIESEMTDEIKDEVYEFLRCSDKYYPDDLVTYKQFENTMFSNGFDDQDYMWKPLIQEFKNLKERVMTAEEVGFHEGDVYKNRYGWTIVIEGLDGDYVHVKQYLDTKPDQLTTHVKLIASLYEHLINFHFTKIKNINESKKRFYVYDREITNQMDSILDIRGISIKPQNAGQGYALYSIKKPSLQVGELLFTPASYYLAGPREDFYWEGSTLEEFEADVEDMAYDVREVVKDL